MRVEDLGVISEKLNNLFDFIDTDGEILQCLQEYKELKIEKFKELTDSDDKIMDVLFFFDELQRVIQEVYQIARWGDSESDGE